MEEVVDPGHLLLVPEPLALELLAEDGQGDGGQGGDHEGDQGQAPVDGEDPDEEGQEGKQLLDEIPHAPAQGLLDLVHVVRHPAHQVAGRGAVEIARGLEEDVLVHPVPHVLDHPVAHGLHEIGGHESEDALAQDDRHHDPGDGLDHLVGSDVQGVEYQVHEPGLVRNLDGPVADEHLVDDRLDQVDEDEGEAGHEEGRDKRQDQVFPLTEGQLEEPEDLFHEGRPRRRILRAMSTAFRAEPRVRLSATDQTQKLRGKDSSFLI
jgi:hypothetical protein